MEESENEIDDEATDNDSTDVNRSENASRQNGDVEGHAPFHVEKTPFSRLRCHVNDLEGQENEIVVFSDCTKDLDNATLLELVQLYIKDEKYEEVKSNIDQVVSRLDYEFYSMKPSAGENTNHVQPTSQNHDAEMAKQYKQCAVFLQKVYIYVLHYLGSIVVMIVWELVL
jgi:hypothetical protein